MEIKSMNLERTENKFYLEKVEISISEFGAVYSIFWRDTTFEYLHEMVSL